MRHLVAGLPQAGNFNRAADLYLDVRCSHPGSYGCHSLCRIHPVSQHQIAHIQYGLIYGSQGIADRLVVLLQGADVIKFYLVSQTDKWGMPPGKAQVVSGDACKHVFCEITSARAGRLGAQAGRLVSGLSARQRGSPDIHINVAMPLVQAVGDARAVCPQCGEAQTRLTHSAVSLFQQSGRNPTPRMLWVCGNSPYV